MFWYEKLINKERKSMKNFLSSKRFWAGVIGIITSFSLIFTGEKTFTEQVPFMATTIIALIQTIIALTSTAKVTLGFRK